MHIDFTGFAGDCLIRGRMDLRRERLTDHLNAHATVTLRDVTLEALEGAELVTTASFTIERSELCAVLASGPRGASILRVPTDERRVQAQIGPYTVLGRYHGPVGATNLRSFTDRDPMVPLTDATIAYIVNGVLEVRDAPVLIINRELAAWYREPVSDEPIEVAAAAPDAAHHSPAYTDETAAAVPSGDVFAGVRGRRSRRSGSRPTASSEPSTAAPS